MGCKSANGFTVDESICSDSGPRPPVLFQCDGCNSSSSGNTSASPSTTTYAPCPPNDTTTTFPTNYDNDDSNDSHSKSYILATTLVVLVVISSGILLVYGKKIARNRLDSDNGNVSNTWIAVRGVDPDDDGIGNDENEGGEIEL